MPPHSLLPDDVLTLHSAATALKCLAGMFSWEISVQESLSGGFKNYFYLLFLFSA